jgi:uncharacterized protein (TIGR02301 family)
MTRARRVLAAALAAAMMGGPAAAAQSRPPAKAEAAPPRPADPPPPPYEPQLLRLAEVMGALAYLRDLCGSADGDKWRARMTSLLNAEATTDLRKERLAGAYNRGFRGYETIYRKCTPNAELVISRYLDEGGRLARDLASRFGEAN